VELTNNHKAFDSFADHSHKNVENPKYERNNSMNMQRGAKEEADNWATKPVILADDVCKGWRQYCGIKEKGNCGCNATEEMGRKIETNKSQNFDLLGWARERGWKERKGRKGLRLQMQARA
jgi:hypothetical protein